MHYRETENMAEGQISESWRYITGGHVWGVACTQNGDTVYCGSGDKRIYCFEARGALAWSYETKGPVFRVATTADGSVIVAGSKDGNVYFLDRTGVLRWSYTTGGQVLTVAITSDGAMILAGSTDKFVYCFNREGQLLWRCDMKSPVRAVAVSDDQDLVLVSSFNNILTCLNKWGEYQWHKESGRYPYRIAASPDGMYIATGSEDRNVSLLDRTGRVLWQYPTDGSVNGIYFCTDNRNILAGSEDQTVYKLDLAGKLVWDQDVGSEVAGVCSTKAGEIMVIGTMDNRLTVLENVPSPGAAMGTIETDIANAKRGGVAVNEVEYLVQSSKLLMSVGDRKKANELFGQAKDELQKAVERRAKLSQSVVNYSQEFQTAIDTLERNVAGIRRDLRDAKYDSCVSLAGGVSEQALRLQKLLGESREQHNRVLGVYSDFENMIKDVQGEGIDVKEGEKYLSAAANAIRSNDYAGAVESLKKTETSVISKRTQFREAMEIMGPVRAHIKNAERYIDVSDAKKLLEEAEKALNANDAEKARENAGLIMDVIEKVKEEAQPSLSLRAGSSEGLTVNKSKFTISITNIGKAHAQDIKAEVIGPIRESSTNPAKIDFLKGRWSSRSPRTRGTSRSTPTSP
jgi:DNA-binding beta-propeller fold protein YncE